MIQFSRPCQYPGCHCFAEHNQSFCKKHLDKVKAERIKSYDQRRESSCKRGYNRKWREARQAFLTEHPLCVECLKKGLTVQATDVDHIIPHKGDMNLFWNIRNWQALCHSCHSKKTAAEDGAFGNASRKT